jgi:hypothetical protein
MRHLKLALALAVGVAFTCSLALNAQTSKEDTPSFGAGGVQIAVPMPWNGAVELGPEKRHFMDQFVPPSNRLIAGYADSDDLPNIHAQDIKAPPRIAVVAVSRQYESTNITESGFRQIIESAAGGFNATVSNYAKDNENSFNQKLKELNLDAAHLTFTQPLSLGCLFSTPNAAGFGTVMQVSLSAPDGRQNSLTKALSVIFIRAKNRVLFAYIFATYKDKDTVIWLRKASEDWAKQIVERNE